jgi:hypothetical protein
MSCDPMSETSTRSGGDCFFCCLDDRRSGSGPSGPGPPGLLFALYNIALYLFFFVIAALHMNWTLRVGIPRAASGSCRWYIHFTVPPAAAPCVWRRACLHIRLAASHEGGTAGCKRCRESIDAEGRPASQGPRPAGAGRARSFQASQSSGDLHGLSLHDLHHL